MRYQVGNMMDMLHQYPEHVVLVTTNNVIKRNGTLVMGAGAALSLCKALPDEDLPGKAGPRVQGTIEKDGFYGVVWLPVSWSYVGIFQTKRHWLDHACIHLIRGSCVALRKVAVKSPDTTFHVNYPGIGLGKLTKTEVEETVAGTLDIDNVCVWTHRK